MHPIVDRCFLVLHLLIGFDKLMETEHKKMQNFSTLSWDLQANISGASYLLHDGQ